jgi:prepilin-type processing-associated H-X9-DG protein
MTSAIEIRASRTIGARCAFTLVEALVAMGIIAALTAITIVAIQSSRAASIRAACANNLRQVGLAMHSYYAQDKKLPPGVSYQDGVSKYPFMSWQARLLPFLEQQGLWDQALEAHAKGAAFNQSPPHPGNVVLPVFACSTDPRHERPSTLPGIGAAFTSYQGVAGTNQFRNDGLLFLDSQIRLETVTDGTSNTLMVGERPPSADERLGWWYGGWGQNQNGSAEVVLGMKERNFGTWSNVCPPGPYAFGPGDFTNQCDAFHFWSPHSGGGANFLFADGNVRFITYSAAHLMPALATRAGGEASILPD